MQPLYQEKDYNRLIEISDAPHRSAFRRDNGRLIHSAVFRRLQGKTQLFPSNESDFFRNRLTHSIEVAQIAKGIAEAINYSHEYFKKNPIDLDLVETAALAHDLGHPPFGHNGERALDDIMKEYGGFEGNAQTLRILAKLEKKTTMYRDFVPVNNGEDYRCGLNLTFRTLAAILKYDQEIPMHRKSDDKIVKGYYYTEKDIVQKIRDSVLQSPEDKKFKTIECQIMDIADDISYSTYDLEDAFKAEFLSPIGILASEPEFINRVSIEVQKSLDDPSIDAEKVFKILAKTYWEIFDDETLNNLIESVKEDDSQPDLENIKALMRYSATYAFDFSKRICSKGYFRTQHTSSLVHEFMSNVIVEGLNDQNPILTRICLDPEIKIQVETLKRYTFLAVIESPKLKTAEYRGYEIIKEIFEAIEDEKGKGFNLLPDDFRELYDGFGDEGLKKRVICDFVAGMTDRYAVEFYARLKSENPQTIFKPF